MANFVKGQTAGRLLVTTNIDFNTYTGTTNLIKYVKPDGTEGSWDASELAGSETTGVIYVDFTSSIYFDQAGFWRIWSHTTLSDSRVAPAADAQSYYVADEGERV